MSIYSNQTELNEGLEKLGVDALKILAFPFASVYIAGSETYDYFYKPDSSGNPNAGVKGQQALDGGVPQTKPFLDKLGDSLLKALPDGSTAENVKDTMKWVAIAVAIGATVYFASKVL